MLSFSYDRTYLAGCNGCLGGTDRGRKHYEGGPLEMDFSPKCVMLLTNLTVRP